jgi:signal transduction histidine kinase/CheY-like chemotaxis protein
MKTEGTMHPLRVLIVEDAENDAMLVLRELARGAYDVIHLRVDTAEALGEALRTREWDLVVSDFSLPTFTAMEVLKILAVSAPDLPCIVVSGTIEEEGAVDAMMLGAGDFVAKDRLTRLLPAVSRELQKAAERQQRKTAEMALGEAQGRMRFALEAAGVGTWESDVASGKSTWSDALERLHGCQVGGFGRTFEKFIETIHPEDQSRVRDEIARFRRDHTEPRFEYRVVWPDRSIHWIARVGQTFYDEAGQPVRAAGIGMDITTQKNLETQLRQAQRMESIGNLAGGIAHDFNNLLTAILGYSNFVLDELPAHQREAPNQMRSDLEQVRNAGERAAALTSQLLAFSRKQIIQPVILNINTIVGNLEPMLRRLIGEDIDLAARPLSGLWSARADVGQLEQVIMNLVVNARDAMPTGGKMTIETANVDLDGAYARGHVAVVPGAYVLLAVSDTGTGMSPEIQARIFEPFFTTKPKDRGTGLGLATTYGIVKQNNGNIWVYSEPGKGTTFKVYLPAVMDTPEGVTKRAPTGVHGGDEAILLVEDDERVRGLARQVLARNGYTVIEASSAEEALRVAARQSRSIHLLLTDVILPGMNGRVLAQQLSEQHPHTKVLYMSGYTDNAIVHHGVLAPGVAFLQKPFTPAALARAVREVLDTGS